MSDLNKKTVINKEPLVLSIDVGTTSIRTMLFEKSSHVFKKTQINYKSNNKKEGISELCAISDINNNIVYCLNDLLANIDQTKYRIVSIGIANMRESLLAWSASTLNPISKFILWNDTRNKHLIDCLKSKMSVEDLEYFRKKTGLNNLSTYFSAGKLKWLLENDLKYFVPQSSEDVVHVGTVDSWILSNFTKEKAFKSDISNACRTGLFNLETLKNDPSLFKFWDLKSADFCSKGMMRFPEIVSSSEFYGSFSLPDHFKNDKIKENIMKWLDNVPIQGCLGDQSASLVGHLKFDEAEIKVTYGTGCFLLLNTGPKRPAIENYDNKLLTTIGYCFPNLGDGKVVYAIEGTIGQAGFLVNWLLKNINLVRDIDHLTEILKAYNNKQSSNDIVFVPALTGLYAPYWDDNCRGAIFGIDSNTEQKDLVIGCIKGLALQVGIILKEMKKYIKTGKMEISVDGGLSLNNEFLALQASLLSEKDYSLNRNSNHEATSFGCAVASAFAYQNPENRVMWNDIDELKLEVSSYQKNLKGKRKNLFSCNPNDYFLNAEYKKWQAAVRRSSLWLLEDGVVDFVESKTAMKSKL
ncbi:hypothetical protein QEN19_003913 [Hanseniaspora menglaensis]